MNILSYSQLARPLDWVKNGFVPLGLLFAEAWSRTTLVIDVALVTVAFCFAASAVYAFNDVSDAAADRQHKFKRQRPVANGKISAANALIFSGVLTLISLAIAAFVRVEALAIVGGYLILNIFYSSVLRRIAFIDVLTIAAGFMLRVLAGTAGVGIPPSGWLLATSLALTLFLGFAKRRAEIVAPDHAPRRSALASYNLQLLDALTIFCGVAAAILYTAFTLDRRSIEGHAAPFLWLTAFPALGMLMRYGWLVFSGRKGENPARDLLGDPTMLILGALWLVLSIVTIGADRII